jgi:putative serine protease PepD
MTDNMQNNQGIPSSESSQPQWAAATEEMPRHQAGEVNPQHAHAYVASATSAPTVTQPHTQPKKPSGAGKTFAFGFLGALLACAIGLGGFVAYDQFGRAAGSAGSSPVDPSTATVTLGTSDPSVINAVEEGQTLSEAVAAKTLPSVVAIYNYQNVSGYGYGHGSAQGSNEPQLAGMGSGVVISDDGYIITNYHVVEDAAKLTINVDGGEREAEYVGGDSSSDIAVLKVSDASGLVAADIGDSDSLVTGEWVMTVGAPLGLEQSVATGVVSATNRSTIMDNSSSNGYYYTNAAPEYTYYPNMIQTDAVINPGNSGGALVDADGKLIGINSMLSSSSGNYAGVGFAIPVNYAMGLAKDIIAGKEPSHAALGVTISQVNKQTAQRYNLPVDSGAYISSIIEGSGAADSDLKEGDIITAIDGKAVASPTDVTLAVRGHAVGDTVKVTVNRDGETKDIDVKLTADTSISMSGQGQQNQNQNQNQQNQNQSPNGSYTEDELQQLLEFLQMQGM